MALFDAYGRLIRKPAKKPELEAYSSRIRTTFSSYPSSGLTPGRLASILKAADQGNLSRQAELYEEIEEKDPYIAGQCQTRKLAVQNLEREVIPADDSRLARRAADLCEAMFDSLDADELLLNMLDAIGKGFSMHEIHWEVEGAEARVRDLEHLHPKYVTFMLPGEPWYSKMPKILTQDNQTWGEEPAPWKTIFHRYQARSGYPTRMGVLRTVAWVYLFKNYAIKDWVGFVEVFAVPLRTGKYPPGASDEDKQALLDGLAALGTDAAAIFSEGAEIQFIEARKSGTVDVFDKFLDWCDNQIAYAILGQTLTSQGSGPEGSGSRALGEVHERVRGDLTEADAKSLQRTMTLQLFAPLVGFNLGWDAPIPKFKLHYEPPEDLASTADLYTKLVDLGYPISVGHAEERFGVPRAKEGEVVLKRPTPAPGGMPGAPLPFLGREVAGSEQRVASEGQQAVDDAADQSASDERASDKLLVPLKKMIQGAASFDEILARIYELYPELDGEAMEDLLNRALFMADAEGKKESLTETTEGTEND